MKDVVSEEGSKREDTTISEKVEKVKEDQSGGGGLINKLVSTLVTPLSPSIDGKATDADDDDEEEEEEEEEKRGVDGCEEEGGGGIISRIVSNFFHQSEGVEETEEDKKEEEELMAGGKIKRLKTEDGGIIHNIVSHLPASIPDDAVPTADEATFLINSLVRD